MATRRRPSRRFLLPLTLAALAAVPTGAAAQATLPAALTGVWIIQQASGDNPVRNATVRFRKDGTFSVSQAGDDWIVGAYRVEGNRVTLLDRTGPHACLWDDGSPKVGVYVWSITEEQMRLEAVRDDCDGRAESLAISWFARPENPAE